MLHTGCAAFQIHTIPKREAIDAVKANSLVTFSYTLIEYDDQAQDVIKLNEDAVKFVNEHCERGVLSKKTSKFLKEWSLMMKACESKGLFDKRIHSTLVVEQEPKNNVHININWRKKMKGMTLFTISAVTLFIIPSKVEQEHHYDVSIYKDSELYQDLRLSASFNTWFSIFLLPVTPFTDSSSDMITLMNKNATMYILSYLATEKMI